MAIEGDNAGHETELENQNEQVSIRKMKDDLLDKLNDKVKLELPESLIEEELKALKANHQFKDLKEKELKKKTEQRVKLGLLLGELGKQFEIKISKDEMKRALMQHAMSGGHPNPQQLMQDFDKNPNQFSGLYAMLFEDKVLDVILKKVTIKEKIIKEKKK